jgi:hypothetical protein
MQRFAITPFAVLGILAGTVPAARAADTTCTTTISSGTINGNLVVPAGASCTLANVTVTGNVQVGKGATLAVGPGTGQTVTIGGNVQADRPICFRRRVRGRGDFRRRQCSDSELHGRERLSSKNGNHHDRRKFRVRLQFRALRG